MNTTVSIWLARMALGWTQAIMPITHREWARAMTEEFEFVEPHDALAFAAGCLRSATVQRFLSLVHARSFPGLLFGTLFFSHASVQNSRVWPWVWPFLGGVVVGCLLDPTASWGASLRSAIRSAMLCSAVFLALGSLFVAVLHLSAGNSLHLGLFCLVGVGASANLLIMPSTALMTNALRRI